MESNFQCQLRRQESDLAATPLGGPESACRGKCSCFLCSPCPFSDAEKPNSGPSHIRVILSPWPTHPVRLFLKVVAENQPQLERSSTPWGPQAFIFTALEMIRRHFQCMCSDLSPDAISHKAPTGRSSYVPLLSLVFLSVGHKNGSKCLFMSQMWGTSLTITRETTAAPSNVWANTQAHICIQTHTYAWTFIHSLLLSILRG